MGVFVVARGDAAKILESSGHALDDIAVTGTIFIESMERFPIDLVGNDRPDLAPLEPGAPVVGVASLVGKKKAGVGQMFGQHDRTRDIGRLSGCQIESQGAAVLIAYGMDLGVAPALGAANGLNSSPPFPPPAQRCAGRVPLSSDPSRLRKTRLLILEKAASGACPQIRLLKNAYFA